jgi:hypothetical protein
MSAWVEQQIRRYAAGVAHLDSATRSSLIFVFARSLCRHQLRESDLVNYAIHAAGIPVKEIKE